MANFLILNGPNLNLLGQREPEVYGHTTLKDIHDRLADLATGQGHSLDFFQSNAEHEIVSKIHQASDPAATDKIDFIIINPAALTHTSIALRDALLGVSIPFIEVHLSNVFSREEFRHHSYLSDIAVGVISGLGASGYEYALQAGIEHIKPS